MAEKKHKGTEFSNVREVWARNEKEARGDRPEKKQTDFGNVEKTWEENEKRAETEGTSSAAADSPNRSEGDYWDRIADDVAAGYKNKTDKDPILNSDQLADDHERGDAAGQ